MSNSFSNAGARFSSVAVTGIVGGDACPRELDRWRAIEVREFREFVSRHRSVRQFDLRDEAARQAKLLGHGLLAQATVFARLAQIRARGALDPRVLREKVARVGRQTTPLRDDALARRTVCEVVGMTRYGLFISWHIGASGLLDELLTESSIVYTHMSSI